MPYLGQNELALPRVMITPVAPGYAHILFSFTPLVVQGGVLVYCYTVLALCTCRLCTANEQ